MSTSILCPHLFRAYLTKASEIVDVYRPQIIAIVQYEEISNSLLIRRIVKKRENRLILKLNSNFEQMENLLEILTTRMWGLEDFISTLIEKKVDNWLAEELFQAYVRHLVSNMKKIQNEKLCECFQFGTKSLVYYSWLHMLKKLDSWLLDIETSLGLEPVHPVKKLLDFVRRQLRIRSSKFDLLEHKAIDESSSSSEESVIEEDDCRAIPATSLTKSGNRKDRTFERSKSTQYLFPIQESTNDKKRLQHRTKLIKRPQSLCDITFEIETEEMTWDDDPEQHFLISDNPDYILQFFESTAQRLLRIDSDESIAATTPFQTANDIFTQDFIESEDLGIHKVSVSTQTSPLIPFWKKRSNSLPELSILSRTHMIDAGLKTQAYGLTSTNSDVHSASQVPHRKDSHVVKLPAKPQVIPANVKPNASREKLSQTRSSRDYGIASSTGNKTSQTKSSVRKFQTSAESKGTSINKPQSLTNTNIQTTHRRPKIATISPSPRQRVLEEFKSKKSNTPPLPLPVYENRLKPEDYGKWCNTNVARTKKNKIEKPNQGTNVA